MKRSLQVAISIGLAVVLFAYFLWGASLTKVWSDMANAHPLWVFLSLTCGLLSYVLRAARWGLILKPVGKTKFGSLFGCTAAGFAASTVLPARAGEVIRPLLLSARTGFPAAGTLASIVTERIFDGAAVLLFFGLSVLVGGSTLPGGYSSLLHKAALWSTAFLVFGVVVAWLTLRYREAAIRAFMRVTPQRFQTRVASFLGHVIEGLDVLCNPIRFLQATAWSLVMWLVIGAQMVLLSYAFGIPLTLPQTFIVMAVSAIGLAVPTPGGVGGFHAAIQFGLVQFMKIDADVARAFAIIHHAICFFPITVIGLVYIAKLGMSLRKLSAMPAQQPNQPPGEGP